MELAFTGFYWVFILVPQISMQRRILVTATVLEDSHLVSGGSSEDAIGFYRVLPSFTEFFFLFAVQSSASVPATASAMKCVLFFVLLVVSSARQGTLSLHVFFSLFFLPYYFFFFLVSTAPLGTSLASQLQLSVVFFCCVIFFVRFFIAPSTTSSSGFSVPVAAKSIQQILESIQNRMSRVLFKPSPVQIDRPADGCGTLLEPMGFFLIHSFIHSFFLPSYCRLGS